MPWSHLSHALVAGTGQSTTHSWLLWMFIFENYADPSLDRHRRLIGMRPGTRFFIYGINGLEVLLQMPTSTHGLTSLAKITRIWQNMLPVCLSIDGFNVCSPGILLALDVWAVHETPGIQSLMRIRPICESWILERCGIGRHPMELCTYFRFSRLRPKTGPPLAYRPDLTISSIGSQNEGNQGTLPSSFGDFLIPLSNVESLSICRSFRNFDVLFRKLLRSVVAPPARMDWTRPWHEILHDWNGRVNEFAAIHSIKLWSEQCIQQHWDLAHYISSLEGQRWVKRLLQRRGGRPAHLWHICVSNVMIQQ